MLFPKKLLVLTGLTFPTFKEGFGLVFLRFKKQQFRTFTESFKIIPYSLLLNNPLHLFFSRYGLEIGTETLASAGIEPRKYEIDYYIARFIFECKDTGSYLYGVILELVKGYFLRLAIYIQPNYNGPLVKTTLEEIIVNTF